MKLTKKIGTLLAALALTSPVAFATISMDMSFGFCRTSAGALVPDGTLWALIVDSSGDSALPQLALNSGISASSSSPFWYANLSVGGTVGGDTVFAMGGFNGTATDISLTGWTSASLTGVTLGTNGLVAGKNFGFYWFPGATYTGAGAYQVGNGLGHQVGGIQTTLIDPNNGADPMVVPTDPATIAPGANSIDSQGPGSLPNSQFLATSIIPEPSSMLLGALGALGLLRRRR